MVQYGHRGLNCWNLRGTPWEKAALRSTLMQLEGATTTNPLRIGSQRVRCVSIPYATLIKAGVEIGDSLILPLIALGIMKGSAWEDELD